MMNYDFCFCAVAVAGFMLRSLSFVKNILFKLMKQPVLISPAARTAAAKPLSCAGSCALHSYFKNVGVTLFYVRRRLNV